MKKNLLFAALLSASGLFAQVNPSDVQSPLDIHFFKKDFPGLRDNFTQVKVLTPAVNGSSFSTWYNFNIVSSTNVITSTGFSDVAPANPLTDELRSTGSRNGNIYIALVEMNDQGTWIPYERQTAYYDQDGKDTAWTVEDHDGTDYVTGVRARIKYDASGNFTGYDMYEFDGNDLAFVGTRKITYGSTQRVTDSIFMADEGTLVPAMIRQYTYNTGKLDSIATLVADDEGENFAFSSAFKIISGADNKIDYILTYTINNNDSIFVETRANIIGGGATGVKELSADQFSIYPVPAKEALHIDVKNGGSYTAEVFDIQGRKLLTGEVSNNTTIDLKGLTNGIYILVLQGTNGELMQKKIVVAN